mmetsp:Transcript_49476/g.111011  ORF Transcript_49476/g.111011 Transcript_49476/m.111011 type:complete len:1260 (+) Transcript_49476:18-3797(+)
MAALSQMELNLASIASPMGAKSSSAPSAASTGQKVASKRITGKQGPSGAIVEQTEKLVEGRGRKRSISLATQAPAASFKALRTGGARASTAPRAESVAQLRELLEVLSTVRQGAAEAATGSKVRELAQESYTRHSAVEVRLLVARCLAEALRVYAPEPPFEAEQLEECVALFLEQLALLAQSGEATERLVLLQRLVEVKAFVLIFECRDPHAIMVELFATCIKVARAGDPHNACGLLTQAVAAALQDAESLPSQVLHGLLESLLPQHLGETRVQKLVQSVLAGMASKSSAALINEYLASCLQQAMSSKDTRHPHRLPVPAAFEVVSEVFKIASQLCSRVLPIVQAALQATCAARRKQATQAAGRLLAVMPDAGSARVPLAKSDELFFERFLERASDADDAVRLAALDGAEALLLVTTARMGLAASFGKSAVDVLEPAVAQVRKALLARCLDPHEAIRIRVVQLAGKVAGTAAGLQLLEQELPTILRRMLDKRPKVREASVMAAATIYGTHALPAWTNEDVEVATALAWLPQLICEAYNVYVAGKNGHTTQLEEHIELHVLGCGAKYSAAERARAMAGFASSVATNAAAQRGFELLLARKRDANRALQKFLRARRHHASPVLEAGPGASSALALSSAGASPEKAVELREVVADGASALQDLARLSPLLEERQARTDLCLTLLRTFDAVRDKTLWETLHTLSQAALPAAELAKLLVEMDRLLRVHRLTELTPVLRRALMCTWLLPEHAQEMLRLWQGGGTDEMQAAARSALLHLPRFFPQAFLPHITMVTDALPRCDVHATRAGLRVLHSVGKCLASLAGQDPHLADSPTQSSIARSSLVQVLLPAMSRAAHVEDMQAHGLVHETGCEACRHGIRALCLLPASEEEAAVQEILQLAQDTQSVANDASLASSLRLATACFEWQAEALRIQRSDLSWAAEGHGRWVGAAWKAIEDGYMMRPQSCMAAVSLLAAAGVEVVMEVPAAMEDKRLLEQFLLQSALALMRGLRRATLPLNTKLLNHVAQLVSAVIGCGGGPAPVDKIIAALQKFQKPGAARMRVADHLRVAGTLPVTLAFSELKRHRESAVRLLQASLAKSARRQVNEQETLLDFLLACFVHFLSHLDCLASEAEAILSPYKATTVVVGLLAEALIQCDEQTQSAEFAGAALRITERVRFFVDRERPDSDLIQKAAQCVKYGVEKSCQYMQKVVALSQQSGSSRGSMPAELYDLKRSDSTEVQSLEAGPGAAIESRLPSQPAIEATPS